ncbi:hypothetical protein BDV11DRAFT_212446 [Aspergillus similis]
MSIPGKCTMLVIGGGPAGSYAASVLAREGIDVVLLEADIFPRYHIGESLLPSVRYYLDFIDLCDKFDKYGFIRKTGASFKVNSRKPGYTDFLAANGAGQYSWNVIRSEADDLIFKHARKSGAKVFDDNDSADLGAICFEYLVDASGRAGLVSTKYLKNRVHNPGLRSIAIWGYWTGAKTYGPGVGDAFAEALEGKTGPGPKKACESTSTLDFYLKMLKETPILADLLRGGQLQSDSLRTISDWSYSASEYAGPHLRIAGMQGHCTEDAAIKWHTQKVTEGYTRFLMIVKSSLDQVHGRDEYILNEIEESAGFDFAFEYFKPIIQGTVDAGGKLSRAEVAKSVEFCARVIKKVEGEYQADSRGHAGSGFHLNERGGGNNGDDILLKVARLNRVVSFSEDFTTDVIDGMAPNMCRGQLGLVPIAVRN